jgi:hypothetical protein
MEQATDTKNKQPSGLNGYQITIHHFLNAFDIEDQTFNLSSRTSELLLPRWKTGIALRNAWKNGSEDVVF